MISCASYSPAYGDSQQYNAGYASGPQVQVSASISFYDQLSPYGRWVSYPGYSQVWIPNAGTGFRPYYTDGHWVYTDYGWTWVSDYPWGWAAFHYGRWLYDDFQGWMWIPGNEWGPAWVSWRTGGDYYGWAPMGPQYTYNAPAAYWSFVPRQYIGNPHINNYYVNNSRNVTIINNTTVINNTTNYLGNRVYAGPSAKEVQRYTGQQIRPARIENTNKPGPGRIDNNRLQLFRPAAPALQRGREADRNKPVQPVNPANNNHPGNQPGRVVPGNDNNPGRGVPGNDNKGHQPGRVTPGQDGNLPGNRPTRETPLQQQQIQREQQQRNQQQQQQIQREQQQRNQQQQQQIQREQQQRNQQQQQQIQREQQQRNQQQQQQQIQREQQQRNQQQQQQQIQREQQQRNQQQQQIQREQQQRNQQQQQKQEQAPQQRPVRER
ncbi:DUF6600 domain-containing protein [Chitinophaga sp. 30R24]|uniref:DUF6600 domain-containing protein n=1 Tax=Chitinophaga sp. 30R24 TaxID=3248838 RepID=UPI003B9121B0